MKGHKRKVDASSTMLLASLVANLQLKRKSWCVQLLKQFILFPDETDSSQKTVSKYDQLIFSDEQIHTMYKKLQTKLMQCQLWAFLNIKYHRYVKAISMMEKPISNIKDKINHQNKAYSFTQIQVYSNTQIKKNRIQLTKHVQVKNKHQGKKQFRQQNRSKQSSQLPLQVNIDIHRVTRYRTPSRSPYRNQSHYRQIHHNKSREQESSRISYPISQIHPSQPSKINSSQPSKIQLQPTQTPSLNRVYRLSQGQDHRENRSRSRSGSITRYEYQLDGSRKIIVHSKDLPVNIKVVRSQSSIQDPPHRVIRTPPKDITYRPYTHKQRQQLLRQQKLRLQYNNNPHSTQQQRSRLTPLKKYGGIQIQNNQNSQLLKNQSLRSKKITRLRSISKNKNNQYLQHLNN